ncbi:hypothetical protein Aglo01_27580 [Actinokineospora globicatena]|nr:hypothetical protein Aglo01_27580 [Actinokineospora globicatena]
MVGGAPSTTTLTHPPPGWLWTLAVSSSITTSGDTGRRRMVTLCPHNAAPSSAFPLSQSYQRLPARRAPNAGDAADGSLG